MALNLNRSAVTMLCSHNHPETGFTGIVGYIVGFNICHVEGLQRTRFLPAIENFSLKHNNPH